MLFFVLFKENITPAGIYFKERRHKHIFQAKHFSFFTAGFKSFVPLGY